MQKQAGYMAAPERFADRSDSSCTAGAVHTWPFASFRGLSADGRFQGEADMNRHARLAGSVKNVEGFGCRPMATMRLAPGRRPKAFNERNRDGRRLVVRLALWEFECRG